MNKETHTADILCKEREREREGGEGERERERKLLR
jgi:hypothetical protein